MTDPTGHESFAFRIPLHEVLGITEVSRGEGRAVMAFDVDPDVHIGAGIVHGGLAPLVMDATAGLAAMSLILGRGYVRATINLTCAYHRPIRAGQVEARCTVVSLTRRHAHVNGEVWAGEDLCATGTVTLVLADGDFPGSGAGSAAGRTVPGQAPA